MIINVYAKLLLISEKKLLRIIDIVIYRPLIYFNVYLYTPAWFFVLFYLMLYYSLLTFTTERIVNSVFNVLEHGQL